LFEFIINNNLLKLKMRSWKNLIKIIDEIKKNVKDKSFEANRELKK